MLLRRLVYETNLRTISSRHMVATLMGGGAPFDSCYYFRGSPIMAGILRLSVLLYQELLIRIRLNLPSYVRSNNIGFLRYITPLLSRRLGSRFIEFAFLNSVQTRHMEALLLRPHRSRVAPTSTSLLDLRYSLPPQKLSLTPVDILRVLAY